MKTSKATIVATVIGYYLIAGAALVEFGTASGHPSATAARLAQREYSDLQKDEGSLTSDIKRLRRDLRDRPPRSWYLKTFEAMASAGAEGEN